MAELGIRNVRNFWLTAQADGGNQVTLGPKSRSGGLQVTLLLREHGEVSNDRVVIVSGAAGGAEGDALVTRIFLPAGAEIEEREDGSKSVVIRKER